MEDIRETKDLFNEWVQLRKNRITSLSFTDWLESKGWS